jgi:chromosome segregation ATPase
MKWKNELDQCGLTEDNVSVGLKNKIKDYYSMVDGIEELKESIDNPTINDDVDELQEQLEDLEEALEDYDNKLVKAVQLYDKNKERYAELSKNLGKGRPRKDGLPPQTKQVVAQTTPTPTTTKETHKAIVVEEGGKDDNKSLGWILGTIALGVVTFGLWNKFRD